MILKESAKPRRRKAEIAEAKRVDQENKQHMEMLLGTEETMRMKRYKMEELPQILKQNEDLVQYLKEKGVMDEVGQVKV